MAGTRRRTNRFPVEKKNAMQYWPRFVPPVRAVFNFVILYLGRYIPFLRLKNALYRLTGMRIGRDVSIGLMAMFDVFYPHLITIGDNSVIGYNATILAHEFLVEELRTGPVEIGSNVLIGANVTILPGVRIGDGAKVSALSLVNTDVPPGSLVGGIPARVIKAGPR